MSKVPSENDRPAASARQMPTGDDGFKQMMAEQRERQGRMRHVQQFLASPVFLDLRDQPITVSDTAEAIEERKRDIDYRIRVLQSLVSLLMEERGALDRFRSVSLADQG